MRKREKPIIPPKCGRLKDACARYAIGESSMRELAEKTGAALKIGRSYLVNFDVVDQYIDGISGVPAWDQTEAARDRANYGDD